MRTMVTEKEIREAAEYDGRRRLWNMMGAEFTGNVGVMRASRPSHRESGLQRACMKWMRLQYPRLMMFAVPNGGYRNSREAAIMVSEGIRTGVSDLILLKACGGWHGLCVEMKYGKGRQTVSQMEFERIVTEEGYLYRVVRSFEEFRELIDNYVKGYLERVKEEHK